MFYEGLQNRKLGTNLNQTGIKEKNRESKAKKFNSTDLRYAIILRIEKNGQTNNEKRIGKI